MKKNTWNNRRLVDESFGPSTQRIILKIDWFQFNMLGCWDEWLIDQASDVPSIFFFKSLIDLGHSKLFIFVFVKLQKNWKLNWNDFCKEFCKKLWKKKILGTSDAWSMSHSSQHPSILNWNQSIFDIIPWVAGSMGQTTHGPSVWCSKYFFFIIFRRLRELKTLYFC